MLKIGLDLDGVTVDFTAGWADAYERWFGVDIDRSKLDGWDAWEEVTHFKTEGDFWAWTDSVPRFWADLPAQPGALGALYELQRNEGHQFQIITSRHDKTRAQTLDWVQRNWPTSLQGGFLPPIHHVAKSAKGTVDEVQVYIDDNPKVLENLRDKPVVICFDQPWNKSFKCGGRVHRVKGWPAVSKFLYTLEHDVEPEPVAPLAIEPEPKAEPES